MAPYIHLFGLQLPSYGVMMAAGLIAAFLLLLYTHKKTALSTDDLFSCALWAIILGFVGSKLLYWLVNLDEIIARPHYLIETLRAGLVFYGAVIGGFLGVMIHCLRKKQNFFEYVDVFAPSLVLAQAFGRVGCFLAGCCYGCESDAACAVVYPAGVGSSAPTGVPLLPTQLFESGFLLLLTVVLVLLLIKRKQSGVVLGWYLLLYGVWRFIIEFFRSDDRGTVGTLSTSQFISVFLVAAGVALLIVLAVKKPFPLQKRPEPADAPAPKAPPAAGGTHAADGEAPAVEPAAPSDDAAKAPSEETHGV